MLHRILGKAQIREWILIDLQPDQLLLEHAFVMGSVADQIEITTSRLMALPNVTLFQPVNDIRRAD